MLRIVIIFLSVIGFNNLICNTIMDFLEAISSALSGVTSLEDMAGAYTALKKQYWDSSPNIKPKTKIPLTNKGNKHTLEYMPTRHYLGDKLVDPSGLDAKQRKRLTVKPAGWYKDDTPVNTKNYVYYDPKGKYYMELLNDGEVYAADRDEYGKPFKPKRLDTKNTNTAQREYYKQSPVYRYTIDKIAKRHNISPELLSTRTNAEGFMNTLINLHNATQGSDDYRYASSRDVLYAPIESLIKGKKIMDVFGTDRTGTFIEQGKVKPGSNTKYKIYDDVNKFNTPVRYARGDTPVDNIDITAATLAYLQKEILKRKPNLKGKELDILTNAAYNRGFTGAMGMNPDSLQQLYGQSSDRIYNRIGE